MCLERGLVSIELTTAMTTKLWPSLDRPPETRTFPKLEKKNCRENALILITVFRIRIDINTDPDLAFKVKTDPDQGFYHS